MSHRDNYKDGVPSCTDLLKWAGYYDGYPNDPTGYYFKRGHFVEQCGTILLQGQDLDDHTCSVAWEVRCTPLGVTERWDSYIRPLRDWVQLHKIKLIGAQMYVENPFESYQGTLDWLLEIDGVLTLVDCKTGTCPKATALQTAGYVMAARISRGFNAQQRLGLQLEPGKCTEHWYKNHKDYDAFRILARCYHLHNPNSREYR